MTFFKMLGAMFVFCSCNAQPKPAAVTYAADNNSLLWEVSGNGLQKPSYLFGTFHLMCRSDINFSAQLTKALENADRIYMELDMDDPAMLLGGFMMMNMKDGTKLQDLYTAAEYEKVNTFFKESLGMPLTMLQKTKPFFLAAMLYPKMMPCKNVSGIEEELMKMAKTNKKEIKGLETLEFQSSVFDSIPYEEQARELLKSIDSLESYQKYFDSMMTVYKSQQLSGIESLFKDSEFGMESHQDILLNKRNKNWVAQLKTLMPQEGLFVAVGAGHLVGEQGLINLLKQEGYQLKPVLNK